MRAPPLLARAPSSRRRGPANHCFPARQYRPVTSRTRALYPHTPSPCPLSGLTPSSAAEERLKNGYDVRDAAASSLSSYLSHPSSHHRTRHLQSRHERQPTPSSDRIRHVQKTYTGDHRYQIPWSKETGELPREVPGAIIHQETKRAPVPRGPSTLTPGGLLRRCKAHLDPTGIENSLPPPQRTRQPIGGSSSRDRDPYPPTLASWGSRVGMRRKAAHQDSASHGAPSARSSACGAHLTGKTHLQRCQMWTTCHAA